MFITIAKDSRSKELESVDHAEPKPFNSQPVYSDDEFYGDIPDYDEDWNTTIF